MVLMGVMRVEECDNLEAAFVDVEVGIPPLKIRRMRLPGNSLREARFDGEPGLVPETLTVFTNLQEKQVERVAMGCFIDSHDRATNLSALAEDMERNSPRGAKRIVEIFIGRDGAIWKPPELFNDGNCKRRLELFFKIWEIVEIGDGQANILAGHDFSQEGLPIVRTKGIGMVF